MSEFLKPRYWKMNLQTFAEEGTDNPGTDGNDGADNGNQTPSIEQLMARLAAVEAESENRKNAISKLMKENGDLNKMYREKLSAEEKAKLDQQEREAKYAEMERRLAIYDAKARYLDMGMSSEMAEEVAGYEVAGDFAKMTDAFQKHLKAVRESAVRDYVDSRQNPAAGHGTDEGADSVAETIAKGLMANKPQRKLDTKALENWAR